MFESCKPIHKEQASKGLGLGGSWYIVKDKDASEEWETLEGAGVQDDWDLVSEAERFGIPVDSKVEFSQRMREFFERRESEEGTGGQGKKRRGRESFEQTEQDGGSSTGT